MQNPSTVYAWQHETVQQLGVTGAGWARASFMGTKGIRLILDKELVYKQPEIQSIFKTYGSLASVRLMQSARRTSTSRDRSEGYCRVLLPPVVIVPFCFHWTHLVSNARVYNRVPFEYDYINPFTGLPLCTSVRSWINSDKAKMELLDTQHGLQRDQSSFSHGLLYC